MEKRWLVVSHERSGTEWLISSLVKNFFPSLYQPNGNQQVRWELDDQRFCDPDVMAEHLFDRDKLRSTLIYGVSGTTGVQGTDHRVPLKSHHAFDFFEPIWERVIDEFNVLYIMRDGRDVMTSMWRHGWNHQGFMPRAYNVRCFIEQMPTEIMGRYHGDYYTENMAERWSKHLTGWKGREGVICVSYEQLAFRYIPTIRSIAAKCDIPIPAKVESPDLQGVRPWIGKVNNWQNFITKDLLAFFEHQAWNGRQVLREQNEKAGLILKGDEDLWVG